MSSKLKHFTLCEWNFLLKDTDYFRILTSVIPDNVGENKFCIMVITENCKLLW